jgi:hypothetical protein
MSRKQDEQLLVSVRLNLLSVTFWDNGIEVGERDTWETELKKGPNIFFFFDPFEAYIVKLLGKEDLNARVK